MSPNGGMGYRTTTESPGKTQEKQVRGTNPTRSDSLQSDAPEQDQRLVNIIELWPHLLEADRDRIAKIIANASSKRGGQ